MSNKLYYVYSQLQKLLISQVIVLFDCLNTRYKVKYPAFCIEKFTKSSLKLIWEKKMQAYKKT